MANESFKNSEYWSAAWVRHIETYLSAPPRCGIWLSNYFSDESLSFLECAGGSCRDSRFLFKKGRKSIGSDFDEKTLIYVSKKYASLNFPLLKEDGFSLSFENKSIDIVFHNGFWVCFDDDNKIVSLLKEQSRVANKYAVALVHNANNKNLISKFKELSAKDDLYKIRFFDNILLDNILHASGIKYKNVRYEKFGGPADRLFTLEKIIPFLSPLIRWITPRLYRYQPWSKVERIAMVIELEN